jgi:hypothetical protein
MQTSAAIVNYKFKERAGAAPESVDAGGHNFSVRQRRLVQLQFRDSLETSAILVTPRAVQKKIANGVQFQPLQLGVALRPDSGNFAQGRLQWILRIWHNWMQI